MPTDLPTVAQRLGVFLNDEQARSFRSFRDLLARSAAEFNLTAVRDPELMETRHFLEAVAFGAELAKRDLLTDGARVLDIGSGAGLPGIPLQQVEKDMSPYQSRGIFVNVDFYAGSVYSMLELPKDIFVPLFAIGRIPGWCTEILEQYDNNMLIRPLLDYTGPKDLVYTPIEQR